MKNSKSFRLAFSGITAALYVALTALAAPISFGPIQLRISESLSVLPLIFPVCWAGLTIGCLISNLIFSTPIDVIAGTSATLVASLLTAYAGLKIKKQAPRIILGELPPILINAIVVPITFLAATDTFWIYLTNVATVGLGQLIVISTLGTAIYLALKKVLKPQTDHAPTIHNE